MYRGYDIHSYTAAIKVILDDKYSEDKWKTPLETKLTETLFEEIKQTYPDKPALSNIKKHTINNELVDARLGKINILQVLFQLWQLIKKHQAYDHFSETLDHIGNTCLQGISHRIIIDFAAFG